MGIIPGWKMRNIFVDQLVVDFCGTKARGPHPIRPLELQVAQSLSLAENRPVNGSWIIQTNPQTVGLGMIRGCLVVEIPWLLSLIADHHPISLKNKRYLKHFKSHPENVCVPNLVTLQVGNWFQCRDPQLLFTSPCPVLIIPELETWSRTTYMGYDGMMNLTAIISHLKSC